MNKCDGCNQDMRTTDDGIEYCVNCGTMVGECVRSNAPRKVRRPGV